MPHSRLWCSRLRMVLFHTMLESERSLLLTSCLVCELTLRMLRTFTFVVLFAFAIHGTTLSTLGR